LKQQKRHKVAVVGVRGAVGEEIREILEQRNFPIAGDPCFFGSENKEPKVLFFKGKKIPIQELKFRPGQFEDRMIVLCSSGSSVSKRFVPHAVQDGAVVIDNTSAFRMDSDVPLVIPEINPEDIKKHRGIIANPNCSAAIMLTAIAPLYRRNRIRRVVCATYQSASGAGSRAMRELETQTGDYLADKPIQKKVLPHQIAFNVFSHNSAVGADGYNEEESKMIEESRKILHDDEIRITTTCIRVPVFRAHSEAIYLEFEKKMTPEEARRILNDAPGVKVVDDPKRNHFPMPIEASGQDDVLVGRIREDLSTENGLALFVSGDQLRKGAALNAVQIAEKLIQA